MVTYPYPEDITSLRPFLIKSEDWRYENEYRTIFRDGVSHPKNKNGSLYLQGDEITDVYIGCEVKEAEIEYIKDLLLRSDFKPKLWLATKSSSSFILHFESVNYL